MMEVTVKYWSKDKSYSVYSWNEKTKKRTFLYDGRSQEFKDWISGKKKKDGKSPRVVVMWYKNTLGWEIAEKKEVRRIVVLSIFEYPKEMGA